VAKMGIIFGTSRNDAVLRELRTIRTQNEEFQTEMRENFSQMLALNGILLHSMNV
jgi:hypothetical protein